MLVRASFRAGQVRPAQGAESAAISWFLKCIPAERQASGLLLSVADVESFEPAGDAVSFKLDGSVLLLFTPREGSLGRVRRMGAWHHMVFVGRSVRLGAEVAPKKLAPAPIKAAEPERPPPVSQPSSYEIAFSRAMEEKTIPPLPSTPDDLGSFIEMMTTQPRLLMTLSRLAPVSWGALAAMWSALDSSYRVESGSGGGSYPGSASLLLDLKTRVSKAIEADRGPPPRTNKGQAAPKRRLTSSNGRLQT